MSDLLLLEDKKYRQNQAKFSPSPEMILFAEAYIESRRNISIACLAVNPHDKSRNVYYARPNGWRWNEDFMLWLNKYCKDWVLKHSGDWYLVALKQAEGGSFQHLEMLMQIAKEFVKPNGLTIQTDGDVHVKTPHAVIFSTIKNADQKTEDACAHNRL